MDITAPRFTDPDKAREHLEAIRWPDGPFCPHCGSLSAKRLPPVHRKATAKHPASTRAGVVQCNDCREQYTVTVGTVFERSKIALNKWLLCNHLLCASKKGMSSHQLARMLGVTYKTAWFMSHRIREAMKPGSDAGPLGGAGKVVEADETFVGGKEGNKHARKRRNYGRGPEGKQAVVTLIERDGHARSFHVANVTAKTLRPLVVTNVDRSSWLMTDENSVYQSLGREFRHHSAVAHKRRPVLRIMLHGCLLCHVHNCRLLGSINQLGGERAIGQLAFGNTGSGGEACMVEQRDWPGASGTDYMFEMYSVGSAFDGHAGVYVFVRRTVAGLWQVLYVGETDDFDASLNTGLERLEAWPRIRDFFATHIGILPLPEMTERRRIEADLHDGMQPPCN